MSRVSTTATKDLTIRTGIGGNVYAYSTNIDTLKTLCGNIRKSASSIYFNKKHNCYAIRIKAKLHKKNLFCNKYDI